MSVDKYFSNTKGAMVFTGNKLEVRVPKRYGKHQGCLAIEDTVKTIGIFKMIINGKIESQLFIPAIIDIEYSSIEDEVTDKGREFHILTLLKGDKLMTSTELMVNNRLGYVLFYEFVHMGHYPEMVNYTNIATLFDYISDFLGISFGVDHSILEIMFAQLFRDPSKINKVYRLTDMKKEPEVIPMRDIAHSARSVTGRLVGNYLSNTLDSVVVNKSDNSSEVENLLRS